MTQPTASIVMPCFNVAATLQDQLDHLLPQIDLTGAELVLIDNNSTDNTREILDSIADRPNITVASATEGQSVAYARNAGTRLARADRLLFCDADDIVSDQWVSLCIEALNNHPIVTGHLDVESLNSTTQRSGRGSYDEPATFYGLFPLAHGGNMGVTRAAWDEIGPLDETLGSVEDMEWSLRAKATGHPIVRVGDAVIHYRYRQTTADLWKQGLLYGQYRPEIARRTNSTLGIRISPVAGLKSWAWLALNSVRMVKPSVRPQLAWVAGNRFGHVLGSIKSRFVVL